MPYITSVERRGIQKGQAQGETIGLRKGLLKGIELGLELKFGADGLRLLPEIQQVTNLAVIEAVHAAIKDAQTPDEIRRVYAGADNSSPG
jgi:flagellar biosynthesis/type III secretory pathway protein FliH